MASAGPAVFLRRRASMLRVGSSIVVVLGVLAMHAISAGAGARCTAAGSASMTPAHARTAYRVSSAVHVHREHSDATAHGVSDCVATPSRKAISQAATIPGAAFALGVLATGAIGRRREVARLPDRLSVAGGLRR